MDNVKISIIVPVYNVQAYLGECLESTIHQSYSNLEIIIVDDASPDDSARIIAEYQNRDSRICTIHHKENIGLSGARNSGLDLASGEYIFFIDSDDSIEKDTCEKLYAKAVEHNADIVACALRRTDSQNKQTLRIDFCDKKPVMVFTGEEIYNAYFDGKIPVCLASKLYKKDIWNPNKLRMPVGMLNEDNYIFYDVLSRCKNFVQINDILYSHRQHSDSITGREVSWKFLEDFLIALKKQKDFFRSGNFQKQTLENSSRRLQHILRSDCIIPDRKTVRPELIAKLLHNAKRYDLEEEVFSEVANSLATIVYKLSRTEAADWWYRFGQADTLKKLKMLAKKLLRKI